MKTSVTSNKRRPGAGRTGLGMALAASLMWVASANPVLADGGTNTVATAAAPQPADNKTDKPVKADPPRQLSGVELYAIHCNRCHPERYPVEFNQGEWKTIMLHMRVRANLPAAQARAIMQYLQEEAGD